MRYFAKTFRKGMSKITPLKQGQEQHLWKTAYQKFKERIDSMDNKFIRADEVAQELSVSKPYAYKLIKKLNDELKQKGFITIAGRVNRQYFEAFAELYTNDVKNRLKENTWLTKEHIIRTKILPYFGKMKISGIGTKAAGVKRIRIHDFAP